MPERHLLQKADDYRCMSKAPMLRQRSSLTVIFLLCAILANAAEGSSLAVHGDRARKILLANGHADDSISCSYQTESGQIPTGYRMIVTASKHDVLEESDVDILPAIEGLNRTVNNSLIIDFERSVGKTTLRIAIVRSDGSEYAVTTVDYVIVGMSFFTTDKLGRRRIVANNKFSVTSYADLLNGHLTALEILMCFSDGYTSTRTESSLRVARVLEQTKVSSTDSAAILSAHSFDSCTFHKMVASPASGESVSLSRDCSFGFLRNPKLLFALRFLRYRSGSVTIKFLCDALVAGSEFEESYETHLSVTVGGTPPPAITSVQPGGPFRSTGGQKMTVAVVNLPKSAIVSLLFKDSLYLRPFGKPDYIESSNTTISTFVTNPGEGIGIPYAVQAKINGKLVSAVWAAEGRPFSFDYSVADPIALRNLDPKTGPISGGTVVTLTGSFPGYDASANSRDTIYCGRFPVPKSSILSASLTSLVFKMPPKFSSVAYGYDISVYVEVEGLRSNGMNFHFESFHAVHIAVLGASYDTGSGIYQVPVCGNRSRDGNAGDVILTPGPNVGAHSNEVRYQWILVDVESREEVLRSEEEWFKIPKSVLNGGKSYEALVLAKEESTGSFVENKIHLHAVSSIFYGLALLTSRYRTISQPLTDVRVTAILFDDGPCVPSSHDGILSADIVFNWKYGGDLFTFSQASTTFNKASMGARRFGREFMIPRRSLQYGTHEVVCTASIGDLPSFKATAAINFTVEPAVPKAQIGSGQSFLQVNSATGFTVTASGSTDFDKASLDPTILASGLLYEWRCEVSTSGGSRFDTVEVCPPGILDSGDKHKEDISVAENAINRLDSAGSCTFLHFFLLVRKSVPGYGIVSSVEVLQTIEVSDTIEESLDRTKLRTLLYSTGSEGLPDVSSWRTHDPLIITPNGPAGIEWRFKLIEPASESYSFLLNPRHLLPYPGYVDSSDLVAGRRALGIANGVLKTDTFYKFKIEFEAPSGGNKSGGYEEFFVRTAQEPSVSFTTMSQTFGTIDTLFVAKARTSFVSLNVKFYFFVDVPGEGRLCVDGCSGNEVVAFRLPKAGLYNISCAISDSRGSTEYSFAPERYEVKVARAPISNATFLHNQADTIEDEHFLQTTFNETLRLSDHASFELKCLSIAQYASAASDPSKKGLVGSLVRQALSRLDDLSATTEPNSPLGRDYVKIALAFSALPTGSEAFGNPCTFQDACRVVQTAVQNTPVSEAYHLEAELVQFLTNMAKHANQHMSGGSNRRRLLQISDSEPTASLYTNILDLAEMTTPALMTVMSRNKPCGYQASRTVPQLSNVTIVIRCNEKGSSYLRGKYSALHWCPEVFSQSDNLPRLFVLSEMNDYIASSNVHSYNHTSQVAVGSTGVGGGRKENAPSQNAGSNSMVLVKTFVLKLRDNSLPIATGNVGPADADLTSDTCFALNQTVKATRKVFESTSDTMMSCRVVDAVKYENVKDFAKSPQKDSYREVVVAKSKKAFTSFDDGARQTSVLARLQKINGVTFGARRGDCISSRPLLLGASALAGLTAGLLVAVISSTLILWMGLTYHLAKSAASSVAPILTGSPYIERDIYGRGTIANSRSKVAASAGPDPEEVVVAFTSPHRTTKATPF